MLPASAARTSCGVGCGLRSSSALALISWPDVQKPHCGASCSMNACCSGCSSPSRRQPFDRQHACDRRPRPPAGCRRRPACRRAAPCRRRTRRARIRAWCRSAEADRAAVRPASSGPRPRSCWTAPLTVRLMSVRGTAGPPGPRGCASAGGAEAAIASAALVPSRNARREIPVASRSAASLIVVPSRGRRRSKLGLADLTAAMIGHPGADPLIPEGRRRDCWPPLARPATGSRRQPEGGSR